MAGPNQTWAQGPESGAGAPGHPTNGDSSSAPYADTSRTTRPSVDALRPIAPPQNLVSDDVWGIQAPVGGTPADPEVPVAKGE